MKKLSALFLVFVLLLGVTVAAAAEETDTGEYDLGNVNNDGEIDLLDANFVVAYYNELVELTEEQYEAADVNGDGEVDIMDANMVVAYYNEVIDSFPAEETEHVHEYECEIIIPPTCSHTGEAVYTCACGDAYTEVVPKNEHVWSEWKVTVEPTETTYGKMLRDCKRCYGGQEANIDPITLEEGHTHSYTACVEAPACEAGGYTTYFCACGHAYTGDETTPTGHTFETVTVPPTTEAQGYDLHTCIYCGMDYVDNITDKLPAETEHEHVYDTVVASQEATCTEGSWEELACACGETIVITGAPIGHDYVTTEVVQPTCEEDGYSVNVCKACGDSYLFSWNMDAYGHNWGEWVVTREPTTTEEGIETRTCLRGTCGKTETRSIDKLPAETVCVHSYVVNARKEPTCEEYGSVTTICEKCGDPGLVTLLSPLGHDWGEWVSANGTDTHTCAVCGKTETRETPANICDEFGYSHIMSEADEARLTKGDYFYEVNCICGRACIGSSYDDAWAKFHEHAAEKQWSYCGEVRWESEGYWVEFPDSTYICARCGTVVEFRHYLCRTSS